MRREQVNRTHRARARKRGAPGAFTDVDVNARLIRQGGKCHYCRAPFRLDTRFQIDHFIPIAKGGSNHACNIVLACPDCNQRKGDKLPHEFMPERFQTGCLRDC